MLVKEATDSARLHFVVVWCKAVLVISFTSQILLYFCTLAFSFHIDAVLTVSIVQVPVNQPLIIWVYKSHESTDMTVKQQNKRTTKNICIFYGIYYLLLFIYYKWWLSYQKQVPQQWISNCIQQNTGGCNYFSLFETPAFGTKVLRYIFTFRNFKSFVVLLLPWYPYPVCIVQSKQCIYLKSITSIKVYIFALCTLCRI